MRYGVRWCSRDPSLHRIARRCVPSQYARDGVTQAHRGKPVRLRPYGRHPRPAHLRQIHVQNAIGAVSKAIREACLRAASRRGTAKGGPDSPCHIPLFSFWPCRYPAIRGSRSRSALDDNSEAKVWLLQRTGFTGSTLPAVRTAILRSDRPPQCISERTIRR